ncbi:MAG: porin family protein [Chitinophagaceae bacterium]
MKKLFGICLSFFFYFPFIQAQHTEFGVKAGYNAASISVEDGADYDSKSGIHIGALAHIHVSSHFAVQPELVYSSQGGQSGNTKLKLGYINVPVLAQYMINEGFRLQTGPQFGFLVSAKQKIGDLEVDVDDAFNSVDISWAIGAGYIFTSGLGIDARYNIGLSNISDDSNNSVKNRVFQVGLFYQFHQHSGKKK